jgi:hypothetical protein
VQNVSEGPEIREAQDAALAHADRPRTQTHARRHEALGAPGPVQADHDVLEFSRQCPGQRGEPHLRAADCERREYVDQLQDVHRLVIGRRHLFMTAPVGAGAQLARHRRLRLGQPNTGVNPGGREPT